MRECMNMCELVAELQKLVGTKIPPGTLRRWAYEGLIRGSKPEGQKGKRGSFDAWPSETVEDAAAIYTLRHSHLPWTKPNTPKAKLLAAKKIVDQFYASFDYFRKAGDLKVLMDQFDKLLKPAPALFFLPQSVNGVMFGGLELEPLVVTWIVTLEKIRHNKPLSEPIGVIFNVKSHVLAENGSEVFKPAFQGITFEVSDTDRIGILFGRR
jgi:hypothetical protein